MTQQRFIVLGDTTTHGGKVITAKGAGPIPHTIDGIPVACVGDKVTCPRCKGVYTILPRGKNTTLNGVEMACEGDPVSDGSYLVSVQQGHSSHETGSGDALEKAATRAKAERESKAKANASAASAEPKNAETTEKREFCLQCWLRSLGQRSSVMPELM